MRQVLQHLPLVYTLAVSELSVTELFFGVQPKKMLKLHGVDF